MTIRGAVAWRVLAHHLLGHPFAVGRPAAPGQDSLLEAEDVVEDSVEAPALQALPGDQAGGSESDGEIAGQRSIDPELAPEKRVLDQLEAAIENDQLVACPAHVPTTSTRPSTTRTCTAGSVGIG